MQQELGTRLGRGCFLTVYMLTIWYTFASLKKATPGLMFGLILTIPRPFLGLLPPGAETGAAAVAVSACRCREALRRRTLDTCANHQPLPRNRSCYPAHLGPVVRAAGGLTQSRLAPSMAQRRKTFLGHPIQGPNKQCDLPRNQAGNMLSILP